MKLKKNLITAAILISGLSSSLSAQNKIEEETTKINVTQAHIMSIVNNKVVVYYRDSNCQRKCKLDLKVFDADYELVYSEFNSISGGTRLIYDISKFPEGKYTFKLYDRRKEVCSKLISNQTNTQSETDRTSLALNVD